MEIDSYKVLEEIALKMGCLEAKVIPADKVVVEDRVRLKCMVGCPHYGQGLRCPPYTPSINEFRKMMGDYSWAMVVKIKPRKIPDEVMAKYKLGNDERERVKLRDRYEDADKTSLSIWSDFAGYYKESLMELLDLESAAFSLGCVFATVFFAGRCMLCEKCNVKEGICKNPILSRFSAEAMGINLLKTAKNIGMNLKFDQDSTPTPIAILFLD